MSTDDVKLEAPGASTLQKHREEAVAAARRILAGTSSPSSADSLLTARYLLRTLGVSER